MVPFGGPLVRGGSEPALRVAFDGVTVRMLLVGESLAGEALTEGVRR